MIDILMVIVISFLITVFLTRIWINKAKQIGLVGKDMNKFDKRKVAETGGIVVIMGITFSSLFYVFIETFFFMSPLRNEIFVVLITLLLAGLVGFIDDILGWKTGIKRIHKVLLTIPIGIPMMVINAGTSVMNVPIIGEINLGLIYPLVVVPIAIIGAANGFNMLAGFNGLEAGLGVIILSTMGYFALFVNQNIWLSVIIFSAVFSLLGFLVFNWFPARVFPGDSMTYSIGALIAMVAILGNMEKIGLILFIPFIIDAILSLWPEFRGHEKLEAFGKPNSDNSLEVPYDKIYGVEHFALWAVNKIKKKAYETNVVMFIYGIQMVFVIIVMLLYAF